jgi:glutathione S-transferase
MAEYTLHCFAQSGNAYKVALALQLAGADWAPRFVDDFGGQTRTEACRAVNVMGEVPLLEHRGQRHSQSRAILDDLAETPGRFGPADGELFRPEEIGVDWARYAPSAEGLTRIRSEPRRVHPYELMPGHPLPAAA